MSPQTPIKPAAGYTTYPHGTATALFPSLLPPPQYNPQSLPSSVPPSSYDPRPEKLAPALLAPAQRSHHRPDALCLFRLAIILFALLMLILDCIHISQLRRSFRLFQTVPWPFSELVGTSTRFPEGAPSNESDLWGYFALLLIPDLWTLIMMVCLCFLTPWHCRDPRYHTLLRVFFTGLLVILILWYPCAEIHRIRAYWQRRYGDEQGSWRVDQKNVATAGFNPSGAWDGGHFVGENDGGCDDHYASGGYLYAEACKGHRTGSENGYGYSVYPTMRRIMMDPFPARSLAGNHARHAPAANEQVNDDGDDCRGRNPSRGRGASCRDDNSGYNVGQDQSPGSGVGSPSECAVNLWRSLPSSSSSSSISTAPSVGSMYLCFTSHRDAVPHELYDAGVVDCGVYRTRNLLAFLLALMLLVELMIAHKLGEFLR